MTKKRNPADYGIPDDGDPDLAEALMNLIDAGKIVDSGQRRHGADRVGCGAGGKTLINMEPIEQGPSMGWKEALIDELLNDENHHGYGTGADEDECREYIKAAIDWAKRALVAIGFNMGRASNA
jgi:hypothetical protein